MGDRSYTPPAGAFANLTLLQDADHPGVPSPNAMMIDHPEEHVVEPNAIENDTLTIINTDSNDQALPLADDCTWSCHVAPPCHPALVLTFPPC